ncbi:tyrosine-type recombinase/integrase [Candidatus Roizmanbacteria bacterium]|nr:tyrosine-type recombinase/integrase [Candidatus Roizmanbacteria bacterium]
MTESILNYRLFLKRKNFSDLTVKNYLHRLQRFFSWVATPVESTTVKEVRMYIDCLLEKKMAPRTINCHISSIRGFYDYLRDEEDVSMENPVITGLMLREPHPLPRYLPDSDVELFLNCIASKRDLSIFMLMLRCGIRVQEVANLTLDVIDYRRSQILIKAGKGAKDRMVFISNDAAVALARYLRERPATDKKQIFLAEKGRCKGKPISVRAIQKRVEHYAKISSVLVTCHRLRHNADSRIMPTCHI